MLDFFESTWLIYLYGMKYQWQAVISSRSCMSWFLMHIVLNTLMITKQNIDKKKKTISLLSFPVSQE